MPDSRQVTLEVVDLVGNDITWYGRYGVKISPRAKGNDRFLIIDKNSPERWEVSNGQAFNFGRDATEIRTTLESAVQRAIALSKRDSV